MPSPLRPDPQFRLHFLDLVGELAPAVAAGFQRLRELVHGVGHGVAGELPGERGLCGFQLGGLGVEGFEFRFKRLEDFRFHLTLLGLDPALFLAVDAGDGLAGPAVDGRRARGGETRGVFPFGKEAHRS